MKTTAWNNLNHKVSPERREELKREAVAELNRMGFAALVQGPEADAGGVSGEARNRSGWRVGNRESV